MKIEKIKKLINIDEILKLESIDSVLEYFAELKYKASEVVSIGIYILYRNDLIPDGSDLRRIWYMLIKICKITDYFRPFAG